MSDTDPTGRLGHPKFECLHCKRIFTRYPSTVKHDPPKYCSGKCFYAQCRLTGWPSPKKAVNVKCETCGIEFVVTPSKAKTCKCCSVKCMLIWRSKTVPSRYDASSRTKIICESCGIEFETRKCRIKGGRGRLCSRECVGAWTIRNAQDRVSGAEKRFCADLEGAGLKFITQAKIGRWTTDILFESIKLVVEYDGEYWHSLPSAIIRDAKKDAYLKEKGYRILRISERLHINDANAAVELVKIALTV